MTRMANNAAGMDAISTRNRALCCRIRRLRVVTVSTVIGRTATGCGCNRTVGVTIVTGVTGATGPRGGSLKLNACERGAGAGLVLSPMLLANSSNSAASTAVGGRSPTSSAKSTRVFRRAMVSSVGAGGAFLTFGLTGTDPPTTCCVAISLPPFGLEFWATIRPPKWRPMYLRNLAAAPAGYSPQSSHRNRRRNVEHKSRLQLAPWSSTRSSSLSRHY